MRVKRILFAVAYDKMDNQRECCDELHSNIVG